MFKFKVRVAPAARPVCVFAWVTQTRSLTISLGPLAYARGSDIAAA